MRKYMQYPTIREEARSGDTVSENQLRQMLARGELPGFYTGRTFRVNHAQLVKKLDEMSAAQITGDAE